MLLHMVSRAIVLVMLGSIKEEQTVSSKINSIVPNEIFVEVFIRNGLSNNSLSEVIIWLSGGVFNDRL